MIGQIEFAMRGQSFKATLDNGLFWRCYDEPARQLLESLAPLESVVSGETPADAGRYMLYRAASRLGGRVTMVAAGRSARPVREAALV